MTGSEHAPGYVPNPDYTQEDWDEVCHNPELTDEQLAQLRPAEEVLPAGLIDKLRQRPPRGKQRAPTKKQIALRVDRDVLEAYRGGGPGWQGRMNDALRRAIGL